jgi:hypothetical protein
VDFAGGHMPERSRLFLIIALGETVLTTGTAIAAVLMTGDDRHHRGGGAGWHGRVRKRGICEPSLASLRACKSSAPWLSSIWDSLHSPHPRTSRQSWRL